MQQTVTPSSMSARGIFRIAVVAIFAIALTVPAFASICTHCATMDARMMLPCCADRCPMHMQHAKPAKVGRAIAPKRTVAAAPVAIATVAPRTIVRVASAPASDTPVANDSPPRFILFSQFLI